MSIKEIQKRLKISRSSASLWVRDVKLNNKQLRKLYLNQKTGRLKGSIIAAQNKKKRTEEITKKIIKEAKKEIGNLSQRDKFIAGVALYFAEGGKTNRNVHFTNADPKAIEFIVKWFKKFCRVNPKKMRGSIYLHSNLNEKKAKQFWSRLTHIPLSQFTKTYKVKNNPHRFRKTLHPYGVFRVTISDVNLHRKIMGWIEAIFR